MENKMNRTQRAVLRPAGVVAALALATVLPPLFLAGCGGSGTSTALPTSAPVGVTRATVTLQWPTRAASRLIPVASNSVRITITNAAGFSLSKVIARPDTGATFDNLPPGALTVTATAHSDAAGNALPPQASGVQVVLAVADQPFALALTMGSTIDHLVVTASAGSVNPGQAATFAVSAQDASGSLILTSGTTYQWSSTNTAVAAAPTGGATVAVTGIANGSTTISVKETESGKTAALPLTVAPAPTPTPTPTPDPFAGVKEYLNLDLTNLANYANPTLPVHYDGNVFAQTNTPTDNKITDRGATVGRVLFFDPRLSVNSTIACATCHQQQFGFTDPRQFSAGFSGTVFGTAHAMRLGNVQFYAGAKMFWDKRAATLEAQATQPVQNSIEMGFDSAHGGMAALIAKMQTLPYYGELFQWEFGDSAITEDRIQKLLAQYERSMVSVNSRFDTGFAQVYNRNAPQAGAGSPFPNYTAQEERGKQLFMAPPNQGGGGCVTCHSLPTFALDPRSLSNGLDAGETRIFKAPSLKNIAITGPYMHDGRFQTLTQVVDHYISGVQDGPALDPRLRPGGQPQRLALASADRDAIVAFLGTLTDTTLTTDPKYTNPFKK
jgi:cytochrome c peroxidase